VQPKTLGQKEYIKLIENNDITFGVGPAGTGKTYLAVAMAVKASIKSIKPNVVFGVSPAGIWRNKSSDPTGSDTSGNESYVG
ncbi:PhoH family protein, partial [Clostridioides difficile]|uniref:PhoH family protein n=1 Tax=Clostridioides difficile TaxID=1496 RepID=UPI001EEE13ED